MLSLLVDPLDTPTWLGLGITAGISMGLLAIDLAGTTPWNASGVIERHERPTLELLEDACTGAHRRPTAPTGGPRRPPEAHAALHDLAHPVWGCRHLSLR